MASVRGRLADTVDSGQSLYDLFWLLIAPLYYSLMESSRLQATLGKRALGIKVTDDLGQRISFRHALGRWVCAALSYLTLDIGFAMAGFTGASVRCTTSSPRPSWWIAGRSRGIRNVSNAR